MYINRQNANKDQVQGGDSNPYSSDTPTSSDQVAGNTSATGATPNDANQSWYNVQDYLKANTGADPAIAKPINKQAQGAMDQAGQQQSGYNSQVGTIADPTAYSQEALNSAITSDTQSTDPTNQLSNNINQSFTTPGAAQKVENPFANTNNYSDLNTWFGNNVGGQYNQGQSNADQLLLGNSNVLPKLKDDTTAAYQQKVENPYNTTEAGRQANVTDQTGKYNAANDAWKTGEQEYLDNSDESIASNLSKNSPTATAPTDISSLEKGLNLNAAQKAELEQLLSATHNSSAKVWDGGLGMSNSSNLDPLVSQLSSPGLYTKTQGTPITESDADKNSYNAVANALGKTPLTSNRTTGSNIDTYAVNQDAGKAAIKALYDQIVASMPNGMGNVNQNQLRQKYSNLRQYLGE